MVIVTLDDYKSYAGIANPKTDEKLQYLIDFVNAYALNYCNTSFEPVSTTSKVTSMDGYEIILPQVPVTGVSELRVNGLVIDPSLYILDPGEGSIEMIGSVTTGRFAIEVDYTYGYDEVPYDLALSALEFVTYLHKREFTKSRNLGNGESSDYGDSQLMPTQVRVGFNMYRSI